MATCQTCSGPVHVDIACGCTLYTCTTPCRVCGHSGDVHRDWYRDRVGAGFCRRCHPEEDGYHHDFASPHHPESHTENEQLVASLDTVLDVEAGLAEIIKPKEQQ
jgi:hypothetical protein